MTVTVLTPAYNRSSGVQALYQSLRKQTVKDFVWLIVDDGSSDDTGNMVKRFQYEADFIIRYIYKENGGKHTALNLGISEIESELTFIVDSDDVLTQNAIEEILELHERYRAVSDLCGYTFLRMFPNGKINGKKFAQNETIASYIDMRINSHDTHAEKAEVFFTRCLREFPFPEYPGEKFLGEDIVWMRMARQYKMVHVNSAIYIGSYLRDGLTINRRKNNILSPVGCMHRAEEFMKSDVNLRYRIKGALQYIVYGRFAGYDAKALVEMSKYKRLIRRCMPLGMAIYRKWKSN